MPTTNPRVMLTVTGRTREIYTETARAMGIPTARLMTQVLKEAEGGIEQLGLALAKAKSGSVNGLEGLAEALQERIDIAGDAQLDLQQEIEKQSSRKAPVKRKNQK
ncbi:hypothetical protein [Microbulbifer sp. THAF38]|uniref:hypothetical protein n=1 Tax=Microbulbifer sp. THAF38 TaxID=2587856 RepID=UPI001268E87F|nr:hypothetical protein [Microbulbifer sp. THAF38]QFT57186.1 hypothetical protein FIU95_21775 [Microbulbifer sp. THAF38]